LTKEIPKSNCKQKKCGTLNKLLNPFGTHLKVSWLTIEAMLKNF
jgi:hypothetical protein